MICRNCHFDIPKEVKFCPNCGMAFHENKNDELLDGNKTKTSINTLKNHLSGQIQEEQKMRTFRKKKTKMFLMICIPSILVVSIIIALMTLYTTHPIEIFDDKGYLTVSEDDVRQMIVDNMNKESGKKYDMKNGFIWDNQDYTGIWISGTDNTVGIMIGKDADNEAIGIAKRSFAKVTAGTNNDKNAEYIIDSLEDKSSKVNINGKSAFNFTEGGLSYFLMINNDSSVYLCNKISD